jgi:hypothetical protein
MSRRGYGSEERLADRLAARGSRTAGDLALTVLAWSETTGTERIVLSIEKRLSGLMAALFGRWTVLGALGGEEISPGVMSMTLASRVDDDGRLRELAVELERRFSGRTSSWRGLFRFGDSDDELMWSILRAPADPQDDAVAEALAVVDDWPDARQALIDWWANA